MGLDDEQLASMACRSLLLIPKQEGACGRWVHWPHQIVEGVVSLLSSNPVNKLAKLVFCPCFLADPTHWGNPGHIVLQEL